MFNSSVLFINCRHFRLFWGIKAGNRDTKGYFCSRFVDKFTKYKIQKLVGARFTKCVFLWSYELQNTKYNPWNARMIAPFCVCCMIVFVGVLFMIHRQTRLYCPYFIYILCTKVGIERRFYSCFYVFVPLSTHFLINLSFLSFLALNLRTKNKEKRQKKTTSKLNKEKRKENAKRKPPHMVCSGLQQGSVLNDMSLVM